jgi:hypothetical protein
LIGIFNLINKISSQSPFYGVSKRVYDLVHVVSGLDGFILLSHLDGSFRIAFQVHAGRIPFRSGEGEHFVHQLEDQHILPQGKAFGNDRYGYAIVADLFDVYLTNSTI